MGLQDHPTFTRAFRSAFGISPTDYRRHCVGATLRTQAYGFFGQRIWLP